MHKALSWFKEYFADYGILIGVPHLFFSSILFLLILPFFIVYGVFNILNDLSKELFSK